MKTALTATALTVLALWLGYGLGHHDGARQERQQWLATGLPANPVQPSVITDERVLQRVIAGQRIVYSDPQGGRILRVPWSPTPINAPDQGWSQPSERLEP